MNVLLAMDASRTVHVLPDALLDRLADTATILDRTPIAAFDDPRFAALAGATDVLLTGWGCPGIGPRELAAMPRLRLVAHAAGTVKAILDPAVFSRGIAVTSAAEANAQPVAEFTLALIILAANRAFRFRDAYAARRDRSLTRPMTDAAIGARGRTVGIVGASKIGRRVIALLKDLDLAVALADPTLDVTAAARLGARLMPLPELMAAADIVSLHAPSLPSTRHMIGRAELAAMKDGASLINTARGALVDEGALIAELASGRIDAMLDVTDPEVPARASPLWELPNVFLTPHIAGAIGLERTRLGEMAVAEIERFARGEPLRHAIAARELDLLA